MTSKHSVLSVEDARRTLLEGGIFPLVPLCFLASIFSVQDSCSAQLLLCKCLSQGKVAAGRVTTLVPGFQRVPDFLSAGSLQHKQPLSAWLRQQGEVTPSPAPAGKRFSDVLLLQ